MYSQNELDEAVAAGAISAEAAASLRAHIERQHSSPTVDEEQFRLLTGFNDIFVAIAAAILLFSVAWIGQWLGANLGLTIENDGPSPLAPLAVAATSWGLALFFTAKRRMFSRAEFTTRRVSHDYASCVDRFNVIERSLCPC